MSATSFVDDYGRRWGDPLWPGGPILGGKDWQTFVPLMLQRRRGAVTPPKLDEIKGRFADAARRVCDGR